MDTNLYRCTYFLYAREWESKSWRTQSELSLRESSGRGGGPTRSAARESSRRRRRTSGGGGGGLTSAGRLRAPWCFRERRIAREEGERRKRRRRWRRYRERERCYDFAIYPRVEWGGYTRGWCRTGGGSTATGIEREGLYYWLQVLCFRLSVGGWLFAKDFQVGGEWLRRLGEEWLRRLGENLLIPVNDLLL